MELRVGNLSLLVSKHGMQVTAAINGIVIRYILDHSNKIVGLSTRRRAFNVG